MANRPSHATQQKILAFLASKPGRSAHKAGPEHLTRWISKRIGILESTVITELENLERQGDVKLQRTKTRDSGTLICTASVLAHVDPEEWAVSEVPPEDPDEEATDNIDYRKLADNLLLAAFEALSAQNEEPLREQVADLERRLATAESTLSLTRAERDEAIGKRREAESQLKQLTNALHEAQQQAAENASEVEHLNEKVTRLQQSVRNMSTTSDLFKGLKPEERLKAGSALAELIRESSR